MNHICPAASDFFTWPKTPATGARPLRADGYRGHGVRTCKRRQGPGLPPQLPGWKNSPLPALEFYRQRGQIVWLSKNSLILQWRGLSRDPCSGDAKQFIVVNSCRSRTRQASARFAFISPGLGESAASECSAALPVAPRAGAAGHRADLPPRSPAF